MTKDEFKKELTDFLESKGFFVDSLKVHVFDNEYFSFQGYLELDEVNKYEI